MASAFTKDTLRTIRATLKRFLSIAAITVLGVTMLVGLTIACEDLRISADTFFDEQKLWDVSVQSTLGLTGDDVDALSALDGVESVEGSWSESAYVGVGDARNTVSVYAFEADGMNQPYVLEGKLPTTSDEIAVTKEYLEDSGKSLGDTVTFDSGEAEGEPDVADDVDGADDDKDDDLDTLSDEEDTEVFERKSYKIVATVIDPMSVAAKNGSSSFRATGSRYSFFVTKGAAATDVYTIVYLRVAGAAELSGFSDAYEDKIAEVTAQAEAIKAAREQARTDEVLGETTTKIDDAEADAHEEFEKAEQELADAQATIDDALAQIADGQAEIDDAWGQIYSGQAELDSQRESALAQMDAAQAELDKARSELEPYRQTYDDNWDTVSANWEANKANWEQLDANRDAITSGAAVNTAKGYVDSAKQGVEAAKVGVTAAEAGVTAAQSAYDAAKADYDANQDDTELKAKYEAAEKGLTDAKAALTKAKAGQTAAEAGLTQAEQGLASAQAAKENLPKLDELKKNYDQLKKVGDGFAKVDSGQAQLDSQRTSAQAQFNSAQAQLDDARAQAASGQAQLDDAAAEAADGQAELDENRETYEQEKAEALQKIADARAKLSDIDQATWYVQDRNSISSYASIDSDASCIEVIGTVFPAIFLTVAILISLTTATRMVEEERGLIGLYKALGYSRQRIMSKYIIYTVAAAVVGGVVGSLLGFLALPYFLFSVFEVMYTLPAFTLNFSAPLCALAVGMFIVGIGLATALTVQAELREQPAALMRPRAPKAGTRIFLERIPAIWQRLSFLNKVTARNLFRYKKRMAMTVFGVAGCTALMIAGFAIYDTVMALSPNQYGGDDRAGVYTYDLLAVTQPEDLETAAEQLTKASEVKSYTAVRTENITLEHAGIKETVQLIVVPSDFSLKGYITLRTEGGEELDLAQATADGGVLATKNATVVLGFATGDEVSMQDTALNQATATIDNIVMNYLGNAIYMTEDTYDKLFTTELEANALIAKLSGSADEQIAFKNKLAGDSIYLSTTSIQEGIRDFTANFILINYVVILITALAAGLSFVVLFTLSTTNISERERELATIKVLGFRRREVRTYVYKELIALAIIGTIVGIPVGAALGHALTYVLNMPSMYFAVEIHAMSYVYSCAMSMIFAVVVCFITNPTLDRVDMVGALKSAE